MADKPRPVRLAGSPNADFGYDVADYTNVAAEYGTMADWDALVVEAYVEKK